MASNSKIEYVNHTLNFWKGCHKVDECCDNCYMYRQAKQYGWDPAVVTKCGRVIWRQPQAKNKQGELHWKDEDMVFVCSWSDFFHEDADQWRAAAWAVIRGRPGLLWIITTKRIERVAKHLPQHFAQVNYPNITIMPTCGTQEMADTRIPVALELKAKYPWIKIAVSIEPMLGAIDLHRLNIGQIESSPGLFKPVFYNAMESYTGHNGIDWVIVGGESGPGARPMHPDHVRSIRDQCQVANPPVPFFFKQWGEWLPGSQANHLSDEYLSNCVCRQMNEKGHIAYTFKVPKKKAGHLLDGKEYWEYPKEL